MLLAPSLSGGVVPLPAMTTRVVIIGAGGFGREVHDWLLNWAGGEATVGRKVDLLGFLDDGDVDQSRLDRIGATFLGGIDGLADLDAAYYVAVGDPATRERIVARCAAMGAEPGPAIVHASAVVGSDVHLSPGAIICPMSVVTTNVHIGAHAHLNLTTTVGHDAFVGDFATINPGATISGGVHLGERVMIGTGASVNQGLTVGDGSIIGAGAAVVKDIPAGVTAVGVPARPLQG